MITVKKTFKIPFHDVFHPVPRLSKNLIHKRVTLAIGEPVSFQDCMCKLTATVLPCFSSCLLCPSSPSSCSLATADTYTQKFGSFQEHMWQWQEDELCRQVPWALVPALTLPSCATSLTLLCLSFLICKRVKVIVITCLTQITIIIS